MSDQLITPDRPLARTTDTAGAPPTHEVAQHRFRWRGIAIRLFVLLLAGGLVALVAAQWDWWVGAARWQTTDDAYLTADLTPLAAKVPGYVRRVVVHDFQKVKAGDLLVEVVDDDYRAQVAQAEGNVASAQATAETIVQQKQLQIASIAEAEATIHASEADLTRYHLETVRQESLLQTGIAGTHQIVEQAIDNEQRAAATLAVNRAKLTQQTEQLNVLASQEMQARATIAVQQAAADLARINLGYTRIIAPVDGMVGQRQVR